MPELPAQIDLLRSTDWRTLIILDACRWDVFEAVLAHCIPRGLQPRPVRSPATCTAEWLIAVKPALEAEDTTYYTANAFVERERAGRGLRVDLRNVWLRHMTPCGLDGRQTVQPWVMNAVVLRQEMPAGVCPRPRARRVVHYAQPHYPPVAMKLSAVSGCRCDYEASAEVVMRAALHLAGLLPGPTVITADHGDMQGEDDLYGHDCRWDRPELWTVPWLELAADAAEGRRRKAEGRSDDDDTTVEQNLEALGYA